MLSEVVQSELQELLLNRQYLLDEFGLQKHSRNLQKPDFSPSKGFKKANLASGNCCVMCNLALLRSFFSQEEQREEEEEEEECSLCD